LIEHAKDCSKPKVFHENVIKPPGFNRCNSKKKPPSLTPVAFKGAWLLQPS